MPGCCAARHDLANDQKGPFHEHVKGRAQQRSGVRVGGVTLLFHLSGNKRQTVNSGKNLTVLVDFMGLSW